MSKIWCTFLKIASCESDNENVWDAVRLKFLGQIQEVLAIINISKAVTALEYNFKTAKNEENSEVPLYNWGMYHHPAALHGIVVPCRFFSIKSLFECGKESISGPKHKISIHTVSERVCEW